MTAPPSPSFFPSSAPSSPTGASSSPSLAASVPPGGYYARLAAGSYAPSPPMS
jgi:hypothetical protein